MRKRKKKQPLLNWQDHLIISLDELAKKSECEEDKEVARCLLARYLRDGLTMRQWKLAMVITRRFEKEPGYQPYKPYFCYIVKGGNHLKVGHAKNVDKRIKELQTGNPKPMELVATKSFKFLSEARRMEKKIHRLCKKTRGIGEWFDFRGALSTIYRSDKIDLEDWLVSELGFIEIENIIYRGD